MNNGCQAVEELTNLMMLQMNTRNIKQDAIRQRIIKIKIIKFKLKYKIILNMKLFNKMNLQMFLHQQKLLKRRYVKHQIGDKEKRCKKKDY